MYKDYHWAIEEFLRNPKRCNKILVLKVYILLFKIKVKTTHHAVVAQSGERETEDLEVACSIHAHGIFIYEV